MTSVASENSAEKPSDDAALDVADIMRLIKAAKSAGYVQAADGHVKPNGPFKSVTLKDMAKKNSQMQSQTSSVSPSSSPDNPQPAIDDTAKPDASSAPENDQAKETVTPEIEAAAKTEIEAEAEGVDIIQEPPAASADDDGPDTGLNTGLDAGLDTSQTDQPLSGEASTDQPNAADCDDTPMVKPDAAAQDQENADQAGFKTTLTPQASSQAEPHAQSEQSEAQQAEYQRGFEDGQAAAKQELEATLGEAITSFHATAIALGKDDNIDLTQLDQAMTGAIIHLASERAGMAIDENPQGFASRIETMVSRIRNRVDAPIIRLHPQDAEIIQSHLEERLAPRGFKLTADESLKRGDARVDVGSIGVMDLIDDQVSLKPASSTPKKDEPKDV